LGAPHYDETMSFSETVFLFFLALVIFGPKKLPEIARQAGKLLAELRRASNEFKSQIETEIAHLEVKQLEVKKEAQGAVSKQEMLPLGAAPQGTVASLSLNPGPSEVPLHESRATLAAPAEATLAGSSAATANLAVANMIAENADIPAAEPSSSLSLHPTESLHQREVASAGQDPHV
jgi:sec-independent protein translocase protein TatB